MADVGDRKLYLGPKLRVLRRELGLNQTQMAEELGVSPSYLNHLERNQRPLTAQMMLRLANTYDIDIRDFAAPSTDGGPRELGEILSDALVRDIGISRDEVLEVAENYPGVTEAVARFYRALTDLRRVPGEALAGAAERVPMIAPIDWLREMIARAGNHFAEIDAGAEAIAADLPEDPALLQAALRTRLKDRHGISVQTVPPDEDSRRLATIALTNHAAAALVMPYERFRQAAEQSRHDLPLLCDRFGVSMEQLAHRLTSLNRTGARGIPFFMAKVDGAGQIAKRFDGEAWPFARYGGTCPRWDAHDAPASGAIAPQLIETMEGKRFVTLAVSVPRGATGARARSVIALGCEAKHAARIVHADGFDAERGEATEVGPGCPLCERRACPDRALPPVTRALDLHSYERTAAPYPFRRV